MGCCNQCKCGKNKTQDEKNLETLVRDYYKIADLTGDPPNEDGFLWAAIIELKRIIDCKNEK